MHQGEKLRKYLKSKDYTQKDLLEMTSFSKSKLYNLYKQSEISKDDQEDLKKDFILPKDFFTIDLDQPTKPTKQYVIGEHVVSYEGDYKDKYYKLLEEYKVLSDKLNKCVEEKELLRDEAKTAPKNVRSTISK